MRAHFVRVPGTSDVGPAALWGARFVRFVLARERDLVRHNATIADMSCFPLRFKGNETIFRRGPGSFSLFLAIQGHTRSLTPVCRGFAISLSAKLEITFGGEEKRRVGRSRAGGVSFQRRAGSPINL